MPSGSLPFGVEEGAWNHRRGQRAPLVFRRVLDLEPRAGLRVPGLHAGKGKIFLQKGGPGSRRGAADLALTIIERYGGAPGRCRKVGQETVGLVKPFQFLPADLQAHEGPSGTLALL